MKTSPLNQRFGLDMSDLRDRGRLWYRSRVIGPVAARSGLLARRLQWPLPLSRPYLRKELSLCRRSGLGDVLMCTPTMREIKRLRPQSRIVFYTGFPGLVRGLPYIDEVRPFEERPEGAIELSYTESLPPTSPPPSRHVARIMADGVGLRLDDVRPDCVLDRDLARGYARDWRPLPRPHIVVNRHASSWTSNKDWPEPHWDELIDRLARRGTVIEIGDAPSRGGYEPDGHYLSLVGRTTLEQLVAVVATADLLVGPVSGPVHIAAAFRVPAVVIYGGYEAPECSAYPRNINLYTPLDCAPCWLRDECPIGRPCLSRITPGRVEAEVDRLRSRLERSEGTRLEVVR